MNSGQSSRWIYTILPINIALGPVGTFVQLYILELHGTVIDVGIAVTLFNAVSIPAAIIWGFATDRIQSRRAILIASYLAVAVTLICFIFTNTIYGIEILYAIFSLVSSATVTPLNLLIMGTHRKSSWASAFARMSMITSIGTMVGLVVGVVWADFLPFHLIVVPLSVLSTFSALLSFLMIREPSVVFEPNVIVMSRKNHHEGLLGLSVLFLELPRLTNLRRVFKVLRLQLTREPAIIYVSIFAFYLASGAFNTSLVPSLYRASVSESETFLISLVTLIVEAASFNVLSRQTKTKSLIEIAVRALLLRGFCYVAMAISVFFVAGITYFGATLIFYPFGVGVGYAAFYVASNVIVFTTLGRADPGSTLGVFGALVASSTVLGSFISGFISFFLGFHVTFIFAAILLGLSAVLTSVVRSRVETGIDAPSHELARV
jgi:MFS family permease